MKQAIIDFCCMALASANFLGGVYLAYVRKFMAVSIILLVIAFAIAALISVYDIEIEIKEDKKCQESLRLKRMKDQQRSWESDS